MKEDMIIAVDAAGGEHAPYEIVKGAIKAVEEYGVEIALVGKKDILHVLVGRHSRMTRLKIVPASEVIGFDESPVKAVTGKPDSSIVVGINLVRDGQASAFVSAGHSGAVVAAALMNIGKVRGIPRPAIGSFINIASTAPIFLIDAGANVDCRPEHLVWFAHLGSLYVHEVLNIESPRVGLLSNGEEEAKGSKLVKETHQLLKKTDLNFIGNIEGHDILKGVVDVVVTDGFTGNILLKTIEGISDSWLYSLGQVGQVFSKAYRLPSKVLHRDIGLDSWTKRLDYREYGGACLLGVKGNIIIAHGRSQAKAIKNAIGLAMKTAERLSYEGLASKIATELANKDKAASSKGAKA